MAGYSGTPLWKKLGLRTGQTAAVVNAPKNYLELLGEDRPEITLVNSVVDQLEFYHIFTKDRAEMQENVQRCLSMMQRHGMIWVSWPKKASKVPTDIQEDTIRNFALTTDLVDVKVCAVDDTWSGLKLVIRKERR